MNRFILIFLLAIFVFSCDSPLDVPSDNQKKEVVDDPFAKDPIIEFEPDSVNFGLVLPYENYKKEIKIKNITDKDVSLNEYEFFNNLFDLEFNKNILEPKGNSGDTYTTEINFSPITPGNIRDTLILNQMLNPLLKIKAIVPHVYGEDVNMGESQVGSIKPSFVSLHNLSSDTVRITGITSSLPEIFSVQPTDGIPIILPPNSEIGEKIFIRFIAQKVQEYKATVTFTTDSKGLIIKDELDVKGEGVE